MLWNPGDNGDTIWGQLDDGPASTSQVWTTVDKRGMTICTLTCGNHRGSPIHRTYNDYTRI